MQNQEKDNPSYFSILTANVRYDKSLSASEKIFYSEITSLCNLKGYCSASNKYFQELYQVGQKTICNWINDLSKNGYIKVSYENNSYRKIYVCITELSTSQKESIKKHYPQKKQTSNKVLKDFISAII